MYTQLVIAVNASYALDHYTPLLLSLQDCKFVRESFNTITTNYCTFLEQDLSMVNAGLVLISIGVILCLFLWILYVNRRQSSNNSLYSLNQGSNETCNASFNRRRVLRRSIRGPTLTPPPDPNRRGRIQSPSPDPRSEIALISRYCTWP
ncbi:hypothetical protein MA16_Dca021088 [Dendrobium catenatum]|uniref:Uncharacterized protein n=1 Tax=Dendrobium catenatum TaxID=906689 RepID=A0A2I0VXY1_9ASPA|nr:hypothetical protein MA16_Dca021088 [Dendrobium catenatum]